MNNLASLQSLAEHSKFLLHAPLTYVELNSQAPEIRVRVRVMTFTLAAHCSIRGLGYLHQPISSIDLRLGLASSDGLRGVGLVGLRATELSALLFIQEMLKGKSGFDIP